MEITFVEKELRQRRHAQAEAGRAFREQSLLSRAGYPTGEMQARGCGNDRNAASVEMGRQGFNGSGISLGV